MNSSVNIKRSVFELLVRILFVVLPTAAVSAYVLNKINLAYTGFDSGTTAQFAWLSSGILTAYVLAWMRGRFIVMSLVVLFFLWIGSVIVANLSGEFDVFYAQAKYWLYTTLFSIGWFAGFLVSRSRLFVVAYSCLLTLLLIVFLSEEQDLKLSHWSGHLLPVFLYIIYMLFLVPQLLQVEGWNAKKATRWVSMVVFLLLLSSLAFYLSGLYYDKDILEDEQELLDRNTDDDKGNEASLGKNYNEKNGLMERGGDPDKHEDKERGNQGGNEDKDGDGKPDDQDGDGIPDSKDDDKDGDGKPEDQDGDGIPDNKDSDKDGDGKPDKEDKGGKGGKGDKSDDDDGFKMKDSMKMGEQQSQSDVLMFCSRLNNFFSDGTPQPIYFVYHYLTKYDPKTETFVRDPLIPSSDEIGIDPSKLDMYRSKVDSTAIKNSFADKKRYVVDADVFISANVWKHALLAPSAAFSVQAIPVDTGYKDLFRSGYHVKSYTSELNNAYFVYNPSANPQILQYQQERFDELSTVKDYSTVDSAYYAYYTAIPQGGLFDSIRALAVQVTAGAKTPVEKVVAIRDYFLSTKPDGSLLYRYTLDPGKPGDPNIPTGGMLRDFLFKSHEGYCTYYAGASTLMLQSVGIPARFTTGFATIDRSDKNKGWYWFYASQAHAWTQVYFPEYGWLDFDMTIASEEGGGVGEAPKPDGTPPVPPPQPWLIIDGIVTEEPEPNSGKLNIRFSNLVFFNEEYHLDEEQEQEVDATLCRFVYGNIDTTFDAIHKGDTVFVISWDDAAKDVPEPDPGKSIEEQMRSFQWPMIADEIYIQKQLPPKQDEDKENDKEKQEEQKKDWRTMLYILLGLGAIALLLVIFFPLIYLLRLRMKISSAHSVKDKAEAVYRAALYQYHMSGFELSTQTALSYAEERVDPAFGTRFSDFIHVYLRLKYSGTPERDGDDTVITTFNQSFRSQVRAKLNSFKSMFRWFHLPRALRYFRNPEALTDPDNYRDVNDSYGDQ